MRFSWQRTGWVAGVGVVADLARHARKPGRGGRAGCGQCNEAGRSAITARVRGAIRSDGDRHDRPLREIVIS